MEKLTQEQLNEVIRLHGLWLNNEQGGVRADLSGKDLSHLDMRGADMRDANMTCADMRDVNMRDVNMRDVNMRDVNMYGADMYGAYMYGAHMRDADMRDADLWNTIGNGKQIKSIQLGAYNVTYTSTVLQIGCKQYPIEKWWSFTDYEILEMDGKKALTFWHKFKDHIKSTIELSPAESTTGKL